MKSSGKELLEKMHVGKLTHGGRRGSHHSALGEVTVQSKSPHFLCLCHLDVFLIIKSHERNCLLDERKMQVLIPPFV